MMQSLQHFARYDAYKDSGVEWLGEIPQGWDIRKIKYLFSIGRGRVIAQTELKDDGLYPVYSSQTENSGILGYIHTYDFDVSQITWTTDGANAGTVFLRSGKHNCTNVCGTLQPKSPDYSLIFLRYTLAVAAQFYKRPDTNGAKIMNGEMAVIPVTLPPSYEQTAIANFLDQKTAEIDQAIALKTDLIERLKEYKQITIQHAVTRGLDPNAKMKASGVEWIGDIPNHWLYEPVKHSLHGIIDCEHKTAPFVDETEFLVVRTTNVKNGKLSFEGAKYTNQKSFTEWTRRGVPAPHDVLLTREAPAGEACLVPADTKLCLGQRMVWLKVNKQKIIPSFLLSLIYSTVGRTYIDFLSSGSTVLHLNMSDIKNIPVLLPPLAEQAAIVAHIEAISAKIDQATDQAQQQINTFTEYKTILINAAVTGKIKVTDDSAQGASHAQ